MDPHESLYLGAVAGMAETYGSPLPRLGEKVTFRIAELPGCHIDTGVVIAVVDGKLVVNVHDEADLAKVDPKVVLPEHILPF